MTPTRVQLSRRRGWRMPPNAVSVARPHRFGNPFRVDDKRVLCGEQELWVMPTHAAAIEQAVKAFRWQLEHHPNVVGFTVDDVRQALAGKDLACWCPPASPCHADVLLEIANRDADPA